MLTSTSLWRNRLARSAVNRKVGGSNPPRDDFFKVKLSIQYHNEYIFIKVKKRVGNITIHFNQIKKV
jgi:hypothetical protein